MRYLNHLFEGSGAGAIRHLLYLQLVQVSCESQTFLRDTLSVNVKSKR